jgi:hypothetical protein
MADELRHIDVGTTLTEAEWEGIDSHQFQGQAIGDTLHATSTSQLSRLQIGATDTVLTVSGGLPAWLAITKVGTISSGLWQGTAVTEVYGGTGQTTWTTGDIPYSSGANTLAKLGIGILNQQIRVSAGGIPEWFTPSASGASVGLAAALALLF